MPKKKRPPVLSGKTYKIPTPCGSIFLRINKDDTGDVVEIMAQMGKAGNCSNAWLEGLSCIWSEAFKFEGMTKDEKVDMVEQILNIRCAQSYRSGTKQFKSCLDEISKTLINELEEESNEHSKTKQG